MPTTPNTATASADKTSSGALVALGTALLGGLVVGFLTRLGQQHLGSALGSLANSAGPWTLVAFAVSLLGRSRPVAVTAAVLTFLALLAGYAISAGLAGYATAARTTAFWVLCALVVGPVVALLGWWARRDPGPGRSLAVAALAGLLVGEGVYGLTVVGDSTSPVYWSVEIGVGVLGLVGLGVVRRPAPQAVLAVAGTAVVAALFLVLYRLPLVSLV